MTPNHPDTIASNTLLPVSQASTPSPGAVQDASDADNFAQLRKATIMLIDDEQANIEIIKGFLEKAGYNSFVSTCEPREALKLIETERPDVIMLDLTMPHVSGLDILNAMRNSKNKMRYIPVVVLTSTADAETKHKALELGATDFLAKPVDPSEMVLRLRNTLAAKAYQDQLTYYDMLTGLPNRSRFVDHMEWALRQAQRYNRLTALLHINIDRFKKVNDALGPTRADEFLKAFADRLAQRVRASDTLARNTGEQALHCLSRLAGDEFTILLVEMSAVEDATLVCQRFLDAVREPFNIGGHEIYATCSIGVAVFPADGTNSDTLLKNAGVAMRFSKKQGGNIYHFYSSDLDERSLQFMALQNELHRAIERNELQLLYQPQIDTQSGNLVGAEALIRWCHAERGFIPPDLFIPLAEETGLIAQIGEWVFSEACRSIKKWSESECTVPRIAINVSGRQFREKTFIPTIRKTIEDSGADPQFITVELTESLLMGSARKNIQMLHEIKEMGFKLSMDDFGTGYSSLSYLSRFPLDELKIDKSFINGVGTSVKNESTAIVVAIIAMAHSLGLKVVAEGIEAPDQLAFLRQHNCDECQGYLFSKPISFEDFSDLLRKNHVSGNLPLSNTGLMP